MAPGRLATLIALTLVLPALAGCLDEDLSIALRVDPGHTLIIDDARFVDGTLLVAQGGTLVLDHADLRIAQALVIEPGATVRATDSTVTFAGDFRRQDLENQGTLTATSTVLTGLRSFDMVDGDARLAHGFVSTSRLIMNGGSLATHGTAWSVADPQSVGYDDADDAIALNGGALNLRNGSIQLTARNGLAATGGRAMLENLTLVADMRGGSTFFLSGGDVTLRNVQSSERGTGRWLSVPGGSLRLIDSPIPSRQDVPAGVGINGHLEVGWTLTVTAATAPGNLPVAGLNVTLTSAHAPNGPSAHGITDENGEVRLDAIQYVYGGGQTRTGNPHVVQADDGATVGASPALVVEGPTSVTLHVLLGLPADAASTRGALVTHALGETH